MTALLIPFLCLSLAALGLNILTGYCGQLSLGTGAFMGVGAVSAWNLAVRLPELNLLVVFVLAGLITAAVEAKITFEDGRTGTFKANLKVASAETYATMRKAG